MTVPAALQSAAVALLAVSIAACAGARPVPAHGAAPEGLAPGGTVFTQDEIRSMGAHSAMDVLQRSRSHLVLARDRSGEVVGITHRGVGSLQLSPEMLLVVDGARVAVPGQLLRTIPARSIVFVQILNGREASARFGSQAGNGVILVRTSAGQEAGAL